MRRRAIWGGPLNGCRFTAGERYISCFWIRPLVTNPRENRNTPNYSYGIHQSFSAVAFCRLYRVSIKGLNNYKEAGDRVLIVANQASYLDGVLLAVFLPDRITFTVDSRIAKAWWVHPAIALVDFFAIDTTNPLSTRSLIKFLSENRRVMIFP